MVKADYKQCKNCDSYDNESGFCSMYCKYTNKYFTCRDWDLSDQFNYLNDMNEEIVDTIDGGAL